MTWSSDTLCLDSGQCIEIDPDSIPSGQFLKQRTLAITITLIFIAILTITGNALVLVATWKEKALHQPNKYFIACLAVADLLVGMILAPSQVYLVNVPVGDITIHVCRFTVWMDTLALTASIYTLVCISFDRCLKIKKPLQYRSRMTTSKSLKMIFTIWSISTVFATYSATPSSGSQGIIQLSMYMSCPADFHKAMPFYTFLAISVFFLPTMAMVIMYALIFVAVRKRQTMLRNGELGEISNHNQRNAFRQNLKAIRMTLVVLGAFMFCWCPYFIYILFYIHYPEMVLRLVAPNQEQALIAYAIISILPYLNSLCNPIIYAWLDNTYREAFKKLFQRLMCRTSNPERRQPPNEIELAQMGTR